MTRIKFLPDYADMQDTSGVTLQKVGIRDVWLERRWSNEKVLTQQSAYVALFGKKGIHMSRLAEVLRQWEDEEITMDNELIDELQSTHETKDVYWKCEWNDVFRGEKRFMIHLQLEAKRIIDETKWYMTYEIPYVSVCPCSAEMCRAMGLGIPHMQRSKLVVTTRLGKDEIDLSWLATAIVVDSMEVVKLSPTLILSREDELEFCRTAAEHQMFVEDVARSIAKMLDDWLEFIDDWVIVAEHEESIHQHNAVAIVWKGVELR